ncbi:unnamed protein product [Lampetra planeri]
MHLRNGQVSHTAQTSGQWSTPRATTPTDSHSQGDSNSSSIISSIISSSISSSIFSSSSITLIISSSIIISSSSIIIIISSSSSSSSSSIIIIIISSSSIIIISSSSSSSIIISSSRITNIISSSIIISSIIISSSISSSSIIIISSSSIINRVRRQQRGGLVDHRNFPWASTRSHFRRKYRRSPIQVGGGGTRDEETGDATRLRQGANRRPRAARPPETRDWPLLGFSSGGGGVEAAPDAGHARCGSAREFTREGRDCGTLAARVFFATRVEPSDHAARVTAGQRGRGGGTGVGLKGHQTHERDGLGREGRPGRDGIPPTMDKAE